MLLAWDPFQRPSPSPSLWIPYGAYDKLSVFRRRLYRGKKAKKLAQPLQSLYNQRYLLMLTMTAIKHLSSPVLGAYNRLATGTTGFTAAVIDKALVVVTPR